MSMEVEVPGAETSVTASRKVTGRTGLRLVLAIGALAALASGAAFWVRRTMPSPVSVPVLSKIQGFSLIDQHNAQVSLQSLEGKVWIADFVFTGCQSACPMLTSRMRALQRYLVEREEKTGHDLGVRLVSFSVDPEVDTPDRLREYATKWGADDRLWLFLTGQLAEVNHAVVDGLKIPFEKGGADTSAFDVMHGEHLVLVDGHGRVRGYFESDIEGLDRLKTAIDMLLTEPRS
jgi:protein SCO1/2